MTVYDAISYAQINLQQKFVALANSDIFLDDLFCLKKDDISSNTSLFLSRYEYSLKGAMSSPAIENYNFFGSHDLFGWYSPLRGFASMIPESRFYLGLPGCENKIMWMLKEFCQLEPRNPSLRLKIFHFHDSNERTYSESQRVNRNGKTSRAPPTF
jgi:hypothetical protein